MRSLERGGVFSCEELTLESKLIELRFSGVRASALFANEAGGHRVQRVPENEKRGRVHSSTVTVAVLPEPTVSQLSLKQSDLVFEAYRAPGAGGQHRNVTDSAIRVTHRPTGITASSAVKSQHRNKELALAVLRARLLEAEKTKAQLERNSARKQQIGSSERSDKIRTVAYQRGRVENHVNGKRISIDRYERGFVDELY